MTLSIGVEHWVIGPVFSFFATAGVAVLLGTILLFADIDSLMYNMDADNLEKVWTGLDRSGQDARGL